MKANLTLQMLIDDFKVRYDENPENIALLEREKSCFEYIFSFEPGALPYYGSYGVVVPGFKEKFTEYADDFNEEEIYLMKRAYWKFVVNKADISKAWKWYQDITRINGKTQVELQEIAAPFVSMIKVYYSFYQWLEEQTSRKSFEKPEEETKIINESLRRPVAFCVCLLYKAGKYDIARMTKTRLSKYVGDNFKNVSAQTVTNTLLGYDLSKQKDKSLFKYSERTKRWSFQDDNFDYMIDTFPDDYNKALKLFDEFK